MRKLFFGSALIAALICSPTLAAPAAPVADPLDDLAALHARLVQLESTQMAAAAGNTKAVVLLARLVGEDARAASAVRKLQLQILRGEN